MPLRTNNGRRRCNMKIILMVFSLVIVSLFLLLFYSLAAISSESERYMEQLKEQKGISENNV